MRFINKLKAFFNILSEPVELDLIAAEIKNGKAFLHPKEGDVSYLVRSEDISIYLNHAETEILTIKKKERTSAKSEPEHKSENKNSTPYLDLERYKKRKLVISLYQDEYDTIMNNAKEYGYKRADYVLACVQSASTKRMEKAHEKIVLSHKELRKQQKEQMKK